MFGIKRKSTQSAKNEEYERGVYRGSIKVHPPERQFGYYEFVNVVGVSPEDLLDKIVQETKNIADRARASVLSTQKSFLNKDLYIHVVYYRNSYGEKPTQCSSGSITSIERLVSTAAHYRLMMLEEFFIWEDARNSRMTGIHHDDYAHEDALNRKIIFSKDTTEEELSGDARFSAVRYITNKVADYA